MTEETNTPVGRPSPATPRFTLSQQIAQAVIGGILLVVVGSCLYWSLGGEPGKSAVEKAAEDSKDAIRARFAAEYVFLFPAKETKHGEDVIANEYTATYQIKGPPTPLGTHKETILNVFYKYDPNAKSATVVEEAIAAERWEK